MTITHTTAVRNGLANYVADAVDAGSTDATGDFEFMTSGDVEVASFNVQNPAFGAASTGTVTLLGTTLEDTNATGGTIALFRFRDRDNTEVFRGSVATSGADINISSTSIAASDTVQLTSFTYSAPQ